MRSSLRALWSDVGPLPRWLRVLIAFPWWSLVFLSLRSLQSRRVEYFTQASAFQKRVLGKVMAHVSGRLLPAIQYARCKLYFNLHHCFPLPIHSPTLHPCPSAPEKKQLNHWEIKYLASPQRVHGRGRLNLKAESQKLVCGPRSWRRALCEPRRSVPREGWQSTCTVFMVFLLFFRHYAVNFLPFYLVKETEQNKTFPCPQRGHPSPLRCRLKLTPLTSHSSLCLQAHSTAVTQAFAPWASSLSVLLCLLPKCSCWLLGICHQTSKVSAAPCLSKTDIPDLCPLSPSPPECCQHPTKFYISAAPKVMSKAINLDQTEDWKASISPTFQTQSFRCRSSLAWKLARDYLYSSTYSQLFPLELNRRVNISASGPQIRQPSHQQSRDRGRHQLFILDRGVRTLNTDLFLFARAL